MHDTYKDIMEHYKNSPSDAIRMIKHAPTLKRYQMENLAKHFLTPKVFPNRGIYRVFAERVPVTRMIEILSITVENDPEHKGLLPYYALPSLLEFSVNEAEKSAVQAFMRSLL